MSAPQLTQYQQGVTIVSGDGLNTFDQTCDTFADLRGFVGTTGMQVTARGQSAVGDGYQGDFYWNQSGAGIDDNVNNIVPSGGGGQWTRLPTGFAGTIYSGLPIYSGTGTSANALLQLTSAGALPAVSGAALTNLPSAATPVPPVVGDARNATMSIASAGVSGTFTADEVILQSALGGTAYNISSYSQVINLSGTGAGGMDTGSAPASGYVSIYAITGASGTSILACNVTTSQGSIYGGAHTPSGYTSGSALLSVWPTNGSSQFVAGAQFGRKVNIVPVTVLSTGSSQSTYTSVSIASAAPPAARYVGGVFGAGNGNTTANLLVKVSGGPAGATFGIGEVSVANTGSNVGSPFEIPVVSSQNLFYIATTSSGTITYTISVSSYIF